VERHQRGVFSILRRRVRNPSDIDDVAQDVFLRAWRSIGSYSPRWAFRTWLYSIAVRASADLARRPSLPTADTPYAESLTATNTGPADAFARREQAHALWALADEVLSDAQRTAIWLCYAESCDPREIGRILGRTPTAVRLLLMRARRTLAGAVTHRRTAGAARGGTTQAPTPFRTR